MSIDPHSICSLKHTVTGNCFEDWNSDFSKSFGNIAFLAATSCHAGAGNDCPVRRHKHQITAENSIWPVFKLMLYIVNLCAKVRIDLSHIIVLSAHKLNVDRLV